MKRIIIFGAGDIAALAYFYFSNDSDYIVEAFTIDQSYITSDSFYDLPLLPFESIQEHYSPKEYDLFIALSYAKLNNLREQKFNDAKQKGYNLVSYVSSRATTFSDLKHGENCFILEDNTIQPYVTIGNNVTLWSGNHIGHHSTIGNNCFISSHVVISGGVICEDNCFLGVNSTIRDHVIIRKNTIVGMGAVVAKDTQTGDVIKGAKSITSPIKSQQLEKI